MRADRRAVMLLALGSLVGICLGILSALPGRPQPADAIAVVNGAPIRAEDYRRAVAMLAGDKRNPLTQADRVHVLERLIEEELLVQAAVSEGLVERDRAVRQAITRAMLAVIVTDSASARPSREELRAFHADNAALFAQADETRPPAFEEIQQPGRSGLPPTGKRHGPAPVSGLVARRGRDCAGTRGGAVTGVWVLRQFENDCSVSPTAARSEGGRCVGKIPLNPPLSKGEACPEPCRRARSAGGFLRPGEPSSKTAVQNDALPGVLAWACCLVVLLWSAQAAAHTRSQSFSSWHVQDGQVRGTFSVRALEATRLGALEDTVFDLNTLLIRHLDSRLTY